MQQQLGEFIRHLRRERSLTQTELGGEYYSKSYVSAVERDKIVPSRDALRFFAEQLDQPQDSFTLLMLENEHGRHEMTMLGRGDADGAQEEIVALLDMVLESVEQAASFSFSRLPRLPQEVIAVMPKEKQAVYTLLIGMGAQEKQDHSTAQAAFEQALTLASPVQRPAILDAIGLNYYQEQEYEAALTYHKRGLSFLEGLDAGAVTPMLKLKLHLHCAWDYRILGSYKQASLHYEEASRYLNASHDLKTAGQTYMGLGYCTYAYTFQNNMPSNSAMTSEQKMSNEEIERNYLRAVGYLVQSRVLYQVCSDAVGESTARITQATILLDLCKRRQQQLAMKEGASQQSSYNLYLDEADEQCRQVLLSWQEQFIVSVQPSAAVETLLYIALAFRVRVSTLRAAFARLSNFQDTAQRELAQATVFCQRLLHALTTSAFSWELVRDGLRHASVTQQQPSLLRLPDIAQIQRDAQGQLSRGKLEVYFAAGEVMEEMGRIANDDNYAFDCYERADQCFRVTLPVSLKVTRIEMQTSDGTQDVGDAMHRYQRYIAILEERLQATPALAENTIKTLLSVLKEGLALQQAHFVQ